MRHPDKIPSLIFADEKGNICDLPDLNMAGMSNCQYREPKLEELIELPEGSELFLLPDRHPVGTDALTGEQLLLEENPFESRGSVQAVAAFMAPAHTALLTTAFQRSAKQSTKLPLFAYTAVGWLDGKFWVAGFRTDNDVRQDCSQFHQPTIERKTKKLLRKYKKNRLIQHLGKCCLTYGCPAARNYFMGRWEAPIPTSPHCNARCVGCISLQPSGCCPSTQERLQFVPTPSEIVEMAVEHLLVAEKSIVSFGQGCEGEPLLQAETLQKSIQKIRQITDQGTINLNSNASLPESVRNLAESGLDSIRVSLNSVQEKYYLPYYKPKNYSFEDVTHSIEIMKDLGKHVSLNYFILPGFTDSSSEFENLCQLIDNHSPDLLQLRNLNMDPEWYLETIGFPKEEKHFGLLKWKEDLQRTFPSLSLGYYNPVVN